MTQTTIAVLGGTGKEGRGLAARWSRAGIPIIIGSRAPERARATAVSLSSHGPPALVEGMGNVEAAIRADIVVSALPADGQKELLREIADTITPKLFITAAIIWPPSPERTISSAEEAKQILGPDSRVAAAFQTVSAASLSDEDGAPEDTLIIADNEETGRLAATWVSKTGIRAIIASTRLEDARTVEAMTGILLKINKRYQIKSTGVQITRLSLKE